MGPADTGPTFAERLGWPDGTRAMVVHADDARMSLASNEDIVLTSWRELHERRRAVGDAVEL